MNKKYLLTLHLSLLFLITALTAAAQRSGGGALTGITPNPTGISPIGWIIFGVIILAGAYFVYWIFTKDKNPF